MVCRFERKVYILPDTGITRHLSRGDLNPVIAMMKPHLAHWQPVAAFRAGMEAMTALLAQKNVRLQSHGNELQDGAVVEEGAS